MARNCTLQERAEAMMDQKLAYQRAMNGGRALVQPTSSIFGIDFLVPNIMNLDKMTSMEETSVVHKPRSQENLLNQISEIRYENYRERKGPNLKDLCGHLKEVASDQRGYRYLIYLLRQADLPEIDLAYEELLEHAQALSIHPYGHYVIQKLFLYLDRDRNSALLEKIAIRQLVTHRHGNYVVQAAVEVLPPILKLQLVSYLKGAVVDIARNLFGSCVLEKIIDPASGLDLSLLSFLTNEIKGQVIHLSIQKYPSKVVQKIIRFVPEDLARPILEILHQSIPALVSYSSGEWVLEKMMKRSRQDSDRVISSIMGNIPDIAIQGSGSYTACTALRLARPRARKDLIYMLSKPEVLGKLIQSSSGQRVLAQMFEVASLEQQKKMKERMGSITST